MTSKLDEWLAAIEKAKGLSPKPLQLSQCEASFDPRGCIAIIPYHGTPNVIFNADDWLKFSEWIRNTTNIGLG